MSLGKKKFVTLFIAVHVVFIFIQIYHQTHYLEQSYKKQNYEKQCTILQEKKQKLTQQLCALKDRNIIKQFAQNKLGMQLNRLDQVKQIQKS